MNELKYSWGFPPDFSTHGAAIDHLIGIVHWFMLALFVGWGIFFVYCLIRFRQRPGHTASYDSSHSKLPKVIEAAVVIFEIFLLVGMAIPVWSKVKNELPPANEAMTVRIVGQQFVWNIQYPGKDNQFGRLDPTLISDSSPLGLDPSDPAGRDDIIAINQLHFPVNQPVIVHLSSKDVIHGFNIPVLRIKQDAVPGMTIPVWFQSTQIGQFEIACAQLCGVGHAMMRGYVTVESRQDFDTWMASQSPAAGGGI